jgi:hypothetical protein
MQIVLDPTYAEHTSLEIEGKAFEYAHAKRDCGAAIVRKLASRKISANDELRVVVGPGNFTAVRTACLVGNAVKFLTGCQLFAKNKDEVDFRKVSLLQAFYASEPSISTPKKI